MDKSSSSDLEVGVLCMNHIHSTRMKSLQNLRLWDGLSFVYDVIQPYVILHNVSMLWFRIQVSDKSNSLLNTSTQSMDHRTFCE